VVAGSPAARAGIRPEDLILTIDDVPVTAIGELLLWIAALLTLYTGYDYLQAGLHHMTADAPPEPPKAVKTGRVL
jgi:hypothetical protein